MAGCSVSLNIYLRSTLGNGGQIRLRTPATAYMLALVAITSGEIRDLGMCFGLIYTNYVHDSLPTTG